MSAKHKPPVPGPAPLHCSKCMQHNALEAEHCKRCNALLWRKCRGCGKRAPRTHSRCSRCMAELPEGVLQTVKHVVKKLARKVSR